MVKSINLNLFTVFKVPITIYTSHIQKISFSSTATQFGLLRSISNFSLYTHPLEIIVLDDPVSTSYVTV